MKFAGAMVEGFDLDWVQWEKLENYYCMGRTKNIQWQKLENYYCMGRTKNIINTIYFFKKN
jgi:hypothetical protein